MEQERHDSLIATKRSMKTVEDAINSISADCKTDKFWADMAKPADVAIAKFKEAEVATSETDQKKARADGMLCLRHLAEQLQSASKAGLFQPESRMCNLILEMMETDPTISMMSPLSSVAVAAHTAQQSAVDVRRHNEASMVGQDDRISRVRDAMVPFVFTQQQDEAEMTVSIRVPSGTTGRDVSVKVARDTLLVSVVGHALQPHVINGRLLHPVDPSAAGWHLEGSGDQRLLVLDIEKASAGVDWSKGLLAIGKAA